MSTQQDLRWLIDRVTKGPPPDWSVLIVEMLEQAATDIERLQMALRIALAKNISLDPSDISDCDVAIFVSSLLLNAKVETIKGGKV